MSDNEQDIVRYTVAIQANPTDGEAYYDRGNAYAEAGRYEAAIADYDEAIRLLPTEGDPYYRRGNLYRRLGDYEQALAAYQQAAAKQDGTMPTFVATLRDLKPAIAQFFDDVLVMDEDTAVRENRLALLQRISALTAGLADLSELEGF